MADKKTFIGNGSRKSAVARVRMTLGKGKISINGKDINEYLPFSVLVNDLMQPLEITNVKNKVDIEANVKGGGFSGQTGAIRLAITNALLDYDKNNDSNSENSFRQLLKKAGLITRDARKKERKKYGLKKARKAPQFSKR